MKISDLIKGQFLISNDRNTFIYVIDLDEIFSTANCLCLEVENFDLTIIYYNDYSISSLNEFTIISKEEFLKVLDNKVLELKKLINE